MCGAGCIGRTQDSLQTWIDYLEVNFDTCVEASLSGQPFVLPTPPMVEAQSGALTCGRLTLDCTLDEETDPYDLEQTCSTSLNEPLVPSPLILGCDIDGDIEIDGLAGNDFTTFEGTVVLSRQSPCTSGSCWFSIDSLEIEADSFSDSGYVGRGMEASLAHHGFGQLDSSTDEGEIAVAMFGLDVTLDGETPTQSSQIYSFEMGNSDSAIFEVSSSQFEIVDAYFEWDDYDLTITSDLATCTCLNCS
ncbi:hypothetical protein ENSA5_18530 [Enhygromyxa salina]|uniref:Uncharacterized protein n=1 Tax=Enhygromyxa salina TaxID=215803 RepID=A0A2S9YCT8_9BACT|nr:hypothetical protein ENSA5_18530 [Enhygromyxa salina]